MDGLNVASPAAIRRDAFLREMERKSMDIFMVYNPTDEDYLVEWDHRYHRVPNKNKDMGFGKGKMELYRYLTEKYAREMKDKLINKENDTLLRQLIEKYTKVGAPNPLVSANDEFEKVGERRTNNPDLIKKWYDVLILGLVREYGMDAPEDTMSGEPMDSRTPEERMFESLNKRYTQETEPQEAQKAPEMPVEAKKVEEVAPVAKKRGRPAKVSLEEVTDDNVA